MTKGIRYTEEFMKDAVFLRASSHFQYGNTLCGACVRKMGAGIGKKCSNIYQSLRLTPSHHALCTNLGSRYLRQKRKCEMECV
jgi:hypothetical protein